MIPRISFLAGLFVATTACTPENTAGDVKKTDDGTNPSCDLKLDNLDGRMFVHGIENEATKGYDEDIMARLTFFHEGETQKVKYTVKSHFSVYDYTCVEEEGGLTCKQDVVDYMEYCRALFVNTGDCTAEAIQQVLGRPTDNIPDDLKKSVETTMAAIKKIKPGSDDWNNLQKGYNNPNVQLRGKLRVKVKNKGDDCKLSVKDTYETMYEKALREQENLIGSAYFVESKKKDLLFEHCPNSEAGKVVAVSNPEDWPKPVSGLQILPINQPVTFRYVGDKEIKPANGCTYTMDTYTHYQATGKGVPVQTDAKGRLDWSFTGTFGDAGWTSATVVRYKACGGGQPEKIDVACAPAKAE